MSQKVKKNILLIFLSFGFLRLYSTTIEGYEPDYAGRILTFYTYSDPILKNKNEVFRLEIDEKGNIRQEVKTSETLFCLSDFDVYKVMVIVPIGSDLKIKLPPLRKKTLVESKNPYFKPIVLWLQVSSGGKDEINHLFSELEIRYNELTSKFFNKLYFQKSAAYYDSVKVAIENEFAGNQKIFIRNQVELKLKLLESDIFPTHQPKIFKGISPPGFSTFNPEFINLFDKVFANKLTYETSSIREENLKKAVVSGNVDFIRNYFQRKYNISSNLIDYVVLKILHDAYYSNQFPKKTILSMINDSSFIINPDKNIPEISSGIIQKLLFLSPGTSAPVICLNDLAGQKQCSDKTKLNTYLFFVDLEMKVCQEHLKYLAAMAPKYKSQLEIFIVIKYSDLSSIKKFFNSNEVPGIKVVENPEDIFAGEYKIRSYPSALLLDENHNVILSPAKNPLDGFENEFMAILRQKQMEKFRNQR